jgi:LuxR family transcriptional regulator, maltose regulon positive regulatory protein
MARATPHVSEDMLTYHSGTEDRSISIGSQAWWGWLNAEHTTTFRFENVQGSFTARREHKNGSWYWYAYRKKSGKLRKVYLGKSEELTPELMDSAVALLTVREREHTLLETSNNALHKHIDAAIEKNSKTPSGHLQGMPLLTTKLSVPPVRPELVARPRLMERLNRGVRRKLTLISAPAGFGKTTLLSAWRATDQGSKMPVAWVSLDAGDNDLSRFWNYISAAFQALAPPAINSDMGRPLRAPVYFPDMPSLEAFLTILINHIATFTGDFVLVLDDYHSVTLQPIHESLAFFLEHLPQHMHLVISSRNDPPLSLVRLRAEGQLIELHAADLRFTLDEVTAFLNSIMDLGLSDKQIATLDTHTEGWIAGLQLAALSMQGREDKQQFIVTFTGSHRHILEYLSTEVFSRQPGYMQDFLLQTSILDRLSESLCDAVTNRRDGQAILERLEQANLFLVPLDEERRWYRYHHLFAEFLRQRLSQAQPALLPELHRRAAGWYEQNGLVAEAMQHALAAGDLQHAARLVEQNGEAMVKSGEMMTLLQWLSALPEVVIRSSPQLSILYAGCLASLGQLDAADVRVQDAESALQQALSLRADLTGEQGSALRTTMGELAAIQTFIVSARGDIPGTIELAQQALEQVPAEDAFLRSLITASLGQAYLLNGDLETATTVFRETKALSEASNNMHALLISIGCEAFALNLQGHLHQAARVYERVLHLELGPYPTTSFIQGNVNALKHPSQTVDRGANLYNLPGSHFPGASLAFIGMGVILYEWNDLDGVLQYLNMGVELGKQWGYMLLQAEAYAYLALVHLARGDIDSAFGVLGQAEQMVQEHKVSPAMAWVLTSRARLWLALGRIDEAMAWGQASGMSVNDIPSFLHEFEQLTFIRLHLLQGLYSEAEQFLDRALQVARSEGRMRSAIEILALQAVSLQMQGKTQPAMLPLKRALALAAAEGYMRTFVDLGRPMLELLHLALSRGVATDYVHKLLAAFEGSGEAERAGLPQRSPLLSEREMDVLRCIAAGKSNQEIAREFVVAISTIKTHVNNIFVKLGVHSRTQAVARAKELGLSL